MFGNNPVFNVHAKLSPVFTFCLVCLFSLLLLVPGHVQAVDLAETSKAVVKLFVTRQAWDMKQPWTKNRSRKVTCSGFFIPQGILTNAHCVADSTYIEVELPGVADKVEGRRKAVNHQVDLALIELLDSSKIPNVSPITFDALPELRDKVVTVGYPAGGRQVSYTEGVVSRIDIMGYAHSNIGSLMVQTDAAINSGNSGGPVFSDKTGASLGVATQRSTSGSSIGYFVPASVINQFIKDIEDGDVEGIPTLGMYMQTLENPAYRASMEMSSEMSGIRVLTTAKGSSAYGLIKPDDVILAIEGHQVFNDGRVPFRGDGKIAMGYYVTTRQVGDTISLDILRDGQKKKIDVKLKKYRHRVIPRMPQYEKKPRFYEVAGIVFRVVEPRYTRSLGKTDPGGIRDYFGVVLGEIEKLQELVVVSNMYDAKVNKGYSGTIENIRVMNVNGKEIFRLEDVIEAFEAAGDREFYTINFENKASIVLDVEQVNREQGIIRQSYNIGQ